MKAPDTLREAALHPRPQSILGFERGRRLALTRGLKRLMVGLRPDRELPGSVLRRGAHLTSRTDTTGSLVKADPKDRITRDIVAWRPFDTGLPLGTVGLLGIPIQHKGLSVIAFILMLPAIGPSGRPDDIALMVRLGGDEKVRIHRATIA